MSKIGGKAAHFLTQKPWTPWNPRNQERIWKAEQEAKDLKQREEERLVQIKRQAELEEQSRLLLGSASVRGPSSAAHPLHFMYAAPPGWSERQDVARAGSDDTSASTGIRASAQQSGRAGLGSAGPAVVEDEHDEVAAFKAAFVTALTHTHTHEHTHSHTHTHTHARTHTHGDADAEAGRAEADARIDPRAPGPAASTAPSRRSLLQGVGVAAAALAHAHAHTHTPSHTHTDAHTSVHTREMEAQGEGTRSSDEGTQLRGGGMQTRGEQEGRGEGRTSARAAENDSAAPAWLLEALAARRAAAAPSKNAKGGPAPLAAASAQPEATTGDGRDPASTTRVLRPQTELEKLAGKRAVTGLTREELVERFPMLANAPVEGNYVRNLATVNFQPVGRSLRNVQCARCKQWGHDRWEKECPLWSVDMPDDPRDIARRIRDDPMATLVAPRPSSPAAAATAVAAAATSSSMDVAADASAQMAVRSAVAQHLQDTDRGSVFRRDADMAGRMHGQDAWGGEGEAALRIGTRDHARMDAARRQRSPSRSSSSRNRHRRNDKRDLRRYDMEAGRQARRHDVEPGGHDRDRPREHDGERRRHGASEWGRGHDNERFRERSSDRARDRHHERERGGARERGRADYRHHRYGTGSERDQERY